MQYQFRKSILENEKQFILLGESLEIMDLKTQVVRSYAYNDIELVKLRFLAKKNMPDAYTCDLEIKGGGSVHINSQHYQGIASFENRATTYTPFIKALHEKLATKNVTFTKGINPFMYWASLVFFIIMAAAFGSIALAALIPYGLITLIVLVILFFRLKTHFKKNKPGNYEPLQIPEGLLP